MQEATLTDDVVRDAAAGAPAALRAIYDGLAPRVLGFLRAHGAEDPEGLTQDVFLKLLPQLPTVQGGAEGVRRLTFTIARARLIDAARARTRTGIAVEYDPQLDARSVDSAETEVARLESAERVRALLAQLPDDQREVVTLRVVADLSLEQVADVMGRSVGAIKQLQRRGMLTLRSALAGEGVTP